MTSVKSQRIIGDNFIQISTGGDVEVLALGDVISDTEPALGIESLVSEFSFGSTE